MTDCNNNNIVSVERDICTGIGNNTIHQLNKLDEKLGKRKRVRIYPITYIQAVYDAKTGTRLDNFLNMVNSIYLPWKGTAKSTRLQVPYHLRRKGLMISYRNIDNEIITEKCILEECIKDDLFKLDSSWVRITDALPVSGNVTIGSNGNWFVDGEDTGFKAQGPKGDNGVPLQPRLSEDGTKIEYSLDGEEWKELFPLSLITPNISFEEPVGLEPGATPTVENVGDGFNVNLQFGLPKAPEVNVGSTTTIGEGNQAKVTNSGTPYAPVLNFQIPKGDTGRGITIKGFYPDLSTLQEKITSPAIGDVYCVGSAEPYTGYVWTNVYNSESQTATPAWQSIGTINKDTTILVNELGDREDVGMTQKGVTASISGLEQGYYELIDTSAESITAFQILNQATIAICLENKISENYTVARFCNTSSYRRFSIYDSNGEEIIDYFPPQSEICQDIEYIERTALTGEILKAYIDWSKLSGEFVGYYVYKFILSEKAYTPYEFSNPISIQKSIKNIGKYGNWFHINPNYDIEDNVEKYISAVSAILIEGNVDFDAKYSFPACANTDSIRQIRLFKGNSESDSVEICRYTWNSKYEGVKEVIIPEYNSSGITAKLVMDFDKFRDASFTAIYSDKISVNIEKATNPSNYVSSLHIEQIENKYSGRYLYIENINNPDIRIIDNAILDISIFGDITDNETYCIGAVTNTETSRSFRIFKRGESKIEACGFTSDQCVEFDKVETFICSPLNDSGIIAIVTLDWNKIGKKSYMSMYDYAHFSNKSIKSLFDNKVKDNSNNLLDDLKLCRIDGFEYLVNKLLNTETGIANARIRYPIRFQDDKFSISAVVKFRDISNFSLYLGRTDNTAGTVGRLYKDELGIHMKLYKTIADTSFVDSKIVPIDVDFSINESDYYLLKLSKNINNFTFSIRDEYGNNKEMTGSNISMTGSGWGIPTLTVESGNIECYQFVYSSDFNRNARLVVFGDSFIEGNSLSNKDDRYIVKISKAIGDDNVAILGKGGESTTSVLSRFKYQILNYSNASYCLLALGTNDTNLAMSKSNLIFMINVLRSLSIKPILTTIPPKVGEEEWNTGFMTNYNDWIRSLGELYIDINKSVTSDSNGLVWKEGFVLEDGIHPSALAHSAIFNMILVMVPNL